MDLSTINILHITNDMGYGGAQKIIYQLCNETKEELNRIIVASVGGIYVEELKNIGITHENIPDLSSKKLRDMTTILHKLTKVVKENKINVIHCHHRMAVFYAKLIPVKTRIIYNNHTIYSDKRIYTHMLLKNVNIVADGIQAKANITDYFGILEKKVVVINNAVDEYDGKYNEISLITDERKKGNFIVMNSARLHPQKGMHYFIDAADILIKRGCKMSFIIVGDGELKDEIIDHIKQLGLDEKIKLLGFRNDIKNTIFQSDLLVLTSIYEGLPLTPMEAFSVKKAVVATDIDGTREVVEHGNNGLLAETKNPKSIADAIYELYSDSAKLKQLSDNAYNSYIEKFSLNQFKKSYLEYYKELK